MLGLEKATHGQGSPYKGKATPVHERSVAQERIEPTDRWSAQGSAIPRGLEQSHHGLKDAPGGYWSNVDSSALREDALTEQHQEKLFPCTAKNSAQDVGRRSALRAAVLMRVPRTNLREMHERKGPPHIQSACASRGVCNHTGVQREKT